MRPQATLHILTRAFACGGIACMAAAATGAGRVAALGHRAAAPLLLLAAAAGWFELRRLRRAYAGLAAEAARKAADAAVRGRELDVRLKLATAERRRVEAILQEISDAVLITGPGGEVLLANETATRAFDIDASRPSRGEPRTLDRCLRDPNLARLIEDMRSPGGAGDDDAGASCDLRRVVEHQVQTPQGLRTFRVTLAAVNEPAAEAAAEGGGGAGQHPGVVAVLRDVTHDRELAELKNDFVSMVSHELRTPLASIKAYVEMLIDGEAVDEQTKRDFYDVIQNEANRLGRLIDNILNIARIESGLLKPTRRPHALADVVRESIEVLEQQAAQKSVRIEETLAPAAAARVFADRDMLAQAVVNLLGNAIKYTPEGGTVTVTTAVDAAAGTVVARVADTGVGIPPKDMPFVFDKFFRGQNNSRAATGTGLGLSLVKQIVEGVHGGRVFAESHVGKGSCFGFELKLHEPGAA